MKRCDDMELEEDCLTKKFRQKAEMLCAREEYCGEDVRQKLIKWGASATQIDEIIAHLYEQKYLDDERYAKLYCVGKNRQLKWGRVKIAYQLRMKRIKEQYIEDGLAEIDEEEYSAGLLKIAQQKWSLIREEDRYIKEGKLCGFLQTKGYEIQEIRNIIKLLQ